MFSNRMKVNYSVLMSIYRDDNIEYVRESISSMINQSQEPNEIVIVYDGPQDNSITSMIDDFKENTRIPFNIVDLKKNVGLGEALANGLLNCNNEIVVRMDSDDVSRFDRCEKLCQYLENHEDVDIVGSHVLEFSDDISGFTSKREVPLTDEKIRKYLRFRDPFNHPSVAFKKSKVLDIGNYSTLRKSQDTELWIRAAVAGLIMANLDESLLFFRFNEKTAKRRKSWQNTRNLIQIRWSSVKLGFNSLFDFFIIFFAQILLFLMPNFIVKYIYLKFLRKES